MEKDNDYSLEGLMRNRHLGLAIVLSLGLIGGGCERQENGAEDDTLEVTIPEDTEERIEEGARELGGAVGEAIEETGEAIEEAGTRIQEEVDEPADTLES